MVTPLGGDPLSRAIDTNVLSAAEAAHFSFDTLPVATAEENTETMAITAVRRALAVAGVAPEDVGLLVHSWVADTEVDWRITARIARLAGSRRAVATGVRQLCNGGALGLQFAAAYLLTEPRVEHSLVLTADALGESWSRRWRHGLGLGDSATALVLSKRPGKLTVQSIVSGGRPDHEATFRADNPFQREGLGDHPLPAEDIPSEQVVFRMRSCLRGTVRDACADAGLDVGDPRIDLVLVNRVSSALVKMLAEGNLPSGLAGKVQNLAEHSGHLFAGDLAANLAHLADVLTPGRFALVLNFGAGFNATCVVVRASDVGGDVVG
ncbi:hypothetical protein [Amycolatopsis sp. EV170708-02-1]|uniref:hypothetical protein n=1 Tax=Amycolatopsis sp. EV170708-02-1 TaxID=2919322 RepID=UPI001F0BFB55|nr:hypothetical protein [Amycolatopsis sp. EV170708-02-1]UMP06995.1 hypothetical protein MJQ72_20240 [Amycolatopsis sp. EV170708-02-1]